MSDAIQEQINTYWSARALAYDTNQTERQQRPGATEVWAGVWQTALPEPAADVLDVGTGSGNVAVLLAQLGYRVTGLDLAEGMLESARRKSAAMPNPPRFVHGDAVSPPFAPDSFDAITARYALWTLRDPADALRAWLELLRPGGVLVAVDSLWYPDGVREAHKHDEPTDRAHDFRAAYSDLALKRLPLAEATDIRHFSELLEANGFINVEVSELPEIVELDERYGVAPGHRVQMQYRMSARRP